MTTLLLSPAGEIVTIEGCAAGTVKLRLVIDNSGFESRQRSKRLERRAGSELGLNRAVHQRLERITSDFVPIPAANSSSKFVGIEGGTTNHGEHLAGAGVERH